MVVVAEARMDDLPALETVLHQLDMPDLWGELHPEALEALTHQAIFFAGRGNPDVEARLSNLYPLYAARLPDERRRDLFRRIRDLVVQGLLLPQVLVLFVEHEPEPGMVSTAALDAASFGAGEGPGGSNGPDYVLKLAVTGGVRNPGAALGALLAIGDAELNAKLALLKPALALPPAEAALAQMASCTTGYVHAATVEFWLAWLEELAATLPESQRVFDWAAHGLASQREALRKPFVLDGKRRSRARFNGSPHPSGFGEIALPEFVASIAPRLLAMTSAAAGSHNFRRALAAWLARRST